jgi:hypothetical protein
MRMPDSFGQHAKIGEARMFARMSKPFIFIIVLSFITMDCSIREIAVLHVQDDGTYSQWFTYQQRERKMVVDFIRSTGYSWIPLTFLTSDEHDHNILYLKEVYFKKEQEIVSVFKNKVIRGKNLWKRDDTVSRGKYSYSFRLKKKYAQGI